MGCYDKKKLTCGNKQYSVCVYHEDPIPEFSDLSGESCVTLQETTTDTYNHLEIIYDNIDLSDLGDDCIDYEEEEPGKIKVREAIKKLEELYCDMQDQLPDALGPFCPDLDYGTLVDNCAVAPTVNTQCEFNQFVLDQLMSIRGLITASTPNNGTLTISKNGTPVGTFTANQSGDTTINITTP